MGLLTWSAWLSTEAEDWGSEVDAGDGEGWSDTMWINGRFL